MEFHVIILIVFITINLTTSTRTTATTRPEKFPIFTRQSPGVYPNEIVGTKIYESVGALTFEFNLPAHPNNDTMAFDYDCPDANFTTDYSCPIFHHLHKFRDDLLTSIDHQRLYPESNLDTSFHIPSCDEISRHFTTMTMAPAKLKRYQSLLRTCVDGMLVKAPLSSRYSQGTTSKTYFTSMVQGFVENYYKLLPSTGKVDKAILLNAITLNNALGFIKFLQDSQSIANGWATCQRSQIPPNFVQPEILKEALEKLKVILEEKNMKLVIPTLDDAISEYYKLDLTDCVMTKKTFLIRILVPIKRDVANWKLFSLQSIPFIYNDGEDKSQLVCTVKDFDGHLYSFDMTSKKTFRLRDCDLKKKTLCHNGETSSFMYSKKTCASEILESQLQLSQGVNSHSQSLSRFCDLNCEPSNLFRLPIILRAGSDKIYIAGGVNDSIKLFCFSKVQTLSPPEEGALELTVPCGCKIEHENVKFVGQEPCGRNLTMVIVKPVHLAPKTEEKVFGEIETTERSNGREPRRGPEVRGFDRSEEFEED